LTPLPYGEEIFDLMAPQHLPYPWLSLVFHVLAFVFAFYLIWFFYRWLTAPVARTKRNLSQSPQKSARRAIERLKLSPIWEEKKNKEICEVIASILKNYANEAFAIGIGAASTTDELLDDLRNSRIDNRIYTDIKRLLLACDQIKYAGIREPERSPDELVELLSGLVAEPGWKR
jgi:hypothetical protein